MYSNRVGGVTPLRRRLAEPRRRPLAQGEATSQAQYPPLAPPPVQHAAAVPTSNLPVVRRYTHPQTGRAAAPALWVYSRYGRYQD